MAYGARQLRRVGAVIACLAASPVCAPAAAQSRANVVLPPLDLGQTSFLDGEAKPGALLEIIGDGATAGYFTDGSGRASEGRHRQWLNTVIAHPVYLSNVPVLGGLLGIEFLVPLTAVHQDLPGLRSTTQGGVGDLTISPLIQWSDEQLLGHPLSLRAALQVVAPTGTYSSGRQISAGQNAWQVSPYLAFTWRAAERCEVSGRAIYDWSSFNNHPPAALDARSSRAGDQFAMDLSTSYAVSDQWRVGVAGYALQQVSDARIDGTGAPGSRQRTFALGPGFLWNRGSTTVVGTAYREFASENRPEGVNAVLRLLQGF